MALYKGYGEIVFADEEMIDAILQVCIPITVSDHYEILLEYEKSKLIKVPNIATDIQFCPIYLNDGNKFSNQLILLNKEADEIFIIPKRWCPSLNRIVVLSKEIAQINYQEFTSEFTTGAFSMNLLTLMKKYELYDYFNEPVKQFTESYTDHLQRIFEELIEVQDTYLESFNRLAHEQSVDLSIADIDSIQLINTDTDEVVMDWDPTPFWEGEL